MAIQTDKTVKPIIPESSLESAEEDFQIPARGHYLGASQNSKYPRSGVPTEVMDALLMRTSPSGLCKACLVDQTY